MEEAVEQVGGCGRFQLLLVPLSFAALPSSIWAMLFMIFGALEPDWWCQADDSPLNTSFWNGSVATIQNGDADLGILENRTERFNSGVDTVPGWKNGTYKMCRTKEGEMCRRIVFDDGMSTVVSQFELVCDRAWIPSLTTSLQMAGVLVGSVVSGQMGDTLGRKITVVSINLLHVIFNLAAAFSTTWQMFIALRTLIGFTVGGLMSVVFSYPAEFIGVKWRGVVGSIPQWGIGATTFSLLVWIVPNWSHLHIIIAASAAACLPAWIFLPESLRWLSVKGHVTKAQHVIDNMARWNRKKAPDIREFLNSDVKPRTYTYYHLFSDWPIAKMSLLNGFMWLFASITYFGISFGIKSFSGDFFLNFFLMSIVEIPPPLLVYVCSEKFGRRWTVTACFFQASLSCLAVVPVLLLMSSDEAGNYITGLCISSKFGITLGWSTMALFAIELYPTVIRNINMGYLNTVARAAAILSPFVMAMGQLYVFFAIIGTLMTLAALCPVFLPETRGQPLQDGFQKQPEKVKMKLKQTQLETNSH